MISFSLQSGSNGNSIYVETSDARLLFDAGISGRQAKLRMAQNGRDIKKVQALIISHDHNDHVRCAGIYHRKFQLPVYVTRRTLGAAANLGPISQVHHFKAGEMLCFGRTKVHTLPTPHDGVDGVAFVIEKGRKRRVELPGRVGKVMKDCSFPGPFIIESCHAINLFKLT